MTDRPLRIEWRARSHEGTVRELNEDSFAALPQLGLWAVADGMGGHDHGERASAQVVTRLSATARADTLEAMLEAAATAIHQANADIVEEGAANGARSGSTVAALVVSGRRFGVLWAGDSRVYLLRDRSLVRLTNDHTQVQDMVDRGIISAEDARGHPMGHVLSRAVGVGDALEIDAIADEVAPGDIFLLCSDGLYNALDEGELAAMLAGTAIEQLADALIERAIAHRADDNVTAIVVRAQEPTLLALNPAEPALAS